jgi:hypothetical protein
MPYLKSLGDIAMESNGINPVFINSFLKVDITLECFERKYLLPTQILIPSFFAFNKNG